MRATTWLAIVLAAAIATGCGGVFGREYEYEEQTYLAPDGSATVVIDASVPALVALHGLPLDPSPSAKIDRAAVRALFVQAGCPVTRLPEAWRRQGRRFLQIRVDVNDVRDLAKCGPLSWSTYSGLTPAGDDAHVTYRQHVAAAASADPGPVNWTGGEIVAFKLHLPNRIVDHNARLLDNSGPREAERGNILTWEQSLTDRRAGRPVDIAVTMDRESILSHTLWLFSGAAIAALATLLGIVWWVRGIGKRRHGGNR